MDLYRNILISLIACSTPAMYGQEADSVFRINELEYLERRGANVMLAHDFYPESHLPEEWVGKVGMNIELFPGILFGKSYYMDDSFGIFNRQPNGLGYYNEGGEYRMQPMAEGKTLVVCPEAPAQRLTITSLRDEKLSLLDGRAEHNNGWFIVNSLLPGGVTENAVEWLITPNTLENYTYDPVMQVSQVGYHPEQDKIAIIEKDKNGHTAEKAALLRIEPDGRLTEVISRGPGRPLGVYRGQPVPGTEYRSSPGYHSKGHEGV